MKKKIIVSALVLSLMTAGFTSAQARWGNRGANVNNCPCATGQVSQVDAATQEKLEAFYNDTLDIRKQLTMKRAEKQALLRSETPDPAAMSKIAGEMFDLRQTLQQKAQEAGVDSIAGAGFGRGQGFGNGDGMGGGRKGKGGGRQMMQGNGYGQGRF
ncbi:MAG: periplasmic heavy metal sensor [Desulfobulbaceae bacterium]|nr:MAG: periplasmic heavy metal sensor [Desulfobulbaceae bacterium]